MRGLKGVLVVSGVQKAMMIVALATNIHLRISD